MTSFDDRLTALEARCAGRTTFETMVTHYDAATSIVVAHFLTVYDRATGRVTRYDLDAADALPAPPVLPSLRERPGDTDHA